MWVRISRCRRSQSIVPAMRVSCSGNAVCLGLDRVPHESAPPRTPRSPWRRSAVRRLATAAGVESGPRERSSVPLDVAGNHRRLELLRVGIGQIQKLGHHDGAAPYSLAAPR